MARTRWPPGPVNPGLLPRPGRSGRQRRWVPKTGAPADKSFAGQPESGVGRFGGQAGTRPQTLRPHRRKTSEAGPEDLPTSSLPNICPTLAGGVQRWRHADYLFGAGRTAKRALAAAGPWSQPDRSRRVAEAGRLAAG